MNDFNQMHALYHAGIKGMKWGIRRFQNEDGTLTEEGKIRYGVGKDGKMSKQGQKKFESDSLNPEGVKQEQFNNAANNVKTASNALSSIPVKSGKTQRGSYPELSDAELQKRVNRLNLEQRYSDLVGDTKYVSSGGEKARELFQTIGAIATVAVIAYPIVKDIAKSFKNRPKRVPKQFRLPAPK